MDFWDNREFLETRWVDFLFRLKSLKLRLITLLLKGEKGNMGSRGRLGADGLIGKSKNKTNIIYNLQYILNHILNFQAGINGYNGLEGLRGIRGKK